MPPREVFESVAPGSGQYSCRRDLRLNTWLFVAVVVYFWQRWLLLRHPEWLPLTRAAVALAPLVPALLYIRSWVQFVRGLDELQRRVQMAAHLFAAWGTLVVGIILSTLHQQGLLDILPHGLGLGGVMVIAFMLWGIGVVIANSRYK